MRSSLPASRGQPPTDIALRLRNWVWYWLVKQATGKSDERLDGDYLTDGGPSGGRPRFFQRVRSLGSDPSLPRTMDRYGESILDRVHANASDAQLNAAHDAFHSDLWWMLSNPSLGAEGCRSVIARIIHARGWYRATPEDRQLGAFFIRDDPAFGQSPDRDHVYSAMLTHLESNPSADNVALLAALFREALNEVALEKAVLLRSSLRACTSLWMRSINNLPYEIGKLVENLVEERLVRNVWATPVVDRNLRNQRQYVRALVKGHLKLMADVLPQNSSYPIVLPSPRLRWLNDNRETLMVAAKHIAEAQQHISNHSGDRIFVDGGLFDEAEWQHLVKSRDQTAAQWQDVEKEVHRAIQPPARETRFCLPVMRGKGMRSFNRSAPYLVDGDLEGESKG